MKRQEEGKPSFQVTDKRFWINESATEANSEAVSERRYPSFVEELKSRTELAERRLKERVRELELENEAFRQRLSREAQRRLEKERNDLVVSLLEGIDNLERALAAAESGLDDQPEAAGSDMARLTEGVRLSLELFLSILRRWGVERLEVLDRPFDPYVAEAVGVRKVFDPVLDQKVVEVLQPGYRIEDQLLRPARVRIGEFVTDSAGPTEG